MSRINQPLVQIGTAPAEGQAHLTPAQLIQLYNDPKFCEAAALAVRAGAQFEGHKNAAAAEMFFRNSPAARLHAQEQQAAAILKAKRERSEQLQAHM